MSSKKSGRNPNVWYIPKEEKKATKDAGEITEGRKAALKKMRELEKERLKDPKEAERLKRVQMTEEERILERIEFRKACEAAEKEREKNPEEPE